MDKPPEITFQGMEKSAAIEAKIAEKVAKLEKHFDRMTHCRVVVAAPHRHSHKGKIYRIKIEIGVPDRAPVVVTHEPEVSRANEDLVTAIRDAFDAARRRLDDAAARLSGTAKNERGRRRPSPVRT
ncbi:MAG TPA: HPF/RaiA family ribosome-associated protein [Hyphomicrobiaceae bacterium]|nr:HPF/RaiA family ribosome-associated protein [Hyphomicrobiaceae bacterium]